VVPDLNITFKRVARTALRAEAVFDAVRVDDVAAQLAATGRADYEVAMTLRDTTGDVVATAVGHYHLRRDGGDGEPPPLAPTGGPEPPAG
jgi:hypothetical protein